MKSEELPRLRGLIEQLIERLNQERSTNAELRRTLELRDAELARARTQLADLRKRLDGLFSQLRGESDSLL